MRALHRGVQYHLISCNGYVYIIFTAVCEVGVAVSQSVLIQGARATAGGHRYAHIVNNSVLYFILFVFVVCVFVGGLNKQVLF